MDSVERCLEDLYQEGKICFQENQFKEAFDVFQKLAAMQYRHAALYFLYVTAALLCEDGFFGKALAIYETLGDFHQAKTLTERLQKALSRYNGFYYKAEDCFGKYLFIQNGKACFETSYLHDGTKNYQYDLQYIGKNIYCRFSIEERQKHEQDYKIMFQKERFAVSVTLIEPGENEFCGEYQKKSDNPEDTSGAFGEDPFSFFETALPQTPSHEEIVDLLELLAF